MTVPSGKGASEQVKAERDCALRDARADGPMTGADTAPGR